MFNRQYKIYAPVRKDHLLPYLPIVLEIVSILSIFTGAGCFLGVALAVLGIVFGFITLKKHPESTKLCYTGIALSIVGLVLTLLIVIGFIAIMVAFCFA